MAPHKICVTRDKIESEMAKISSLARYYTMKRVYPQTIDFVNIVKMCYESFIAFNDRNMTAIDFI